MISENSLEIEADGKGSLEVVSQFGVEKFLENVFQINSLLFDMMFFIFINKF